MPLSRSKVEHIHPRHASLEVTQQREIRLYATMADLGGASPIVGALHAPTSTGELLGQALRALLSNSATGEAGGPAVGRQGAPNVAGREVTSGQRHGGCTLPLRYAAEVGTA
jgi:hypothetical protein